MFAHSASSDFLMLRMKRKETRRCFELKYTTFSSFEALLFPLRTASKHHQLTLQDVVAIMFRYFDDVFLMRIIRVS